MQLVLVNPPPRRRAELYDTPNYPPLGLAYLAGAALAAGVPTAIVDAKLHRLDLTATVAAIIRHQPAAVGITAMTHEIKQAATVAAALKQQHPDVRLIIGGVHATFLPRETLDEFPSFDIAVIGEGERTLVRIMAREALAGIPGIAWRKDGEIISNGPATSVANLDELAPPAWHLWPPLPVYHLITTRGCPYRCIFCAQAHGNRVRSHSAQRVVADFQHIIENYHPRRVYFADETFALDRQRAFTILRRFQELGLGQRTPWWAGSRADCADLTLYREMKKAGCFLIQLGIESGSDEILKRIAKKLTIEKARAAVATAKQAGLLVETLFIIGHPHETPAQVEETLAFIRELDPDKLAIGLMVPYPGTKLAAMIKRGEGGYRLLSTDWNAFNKQLGKALELETMSRRQMELAQLRGYLGLYIWRGRIIDFLKFAWTNWRGALAFIRNFASGSEVPDWYPAGRAPDHEPGGKAKN